MSCDQVERGKEVLQKRVGASLQGTDRQAGERGYAGQNLTGVYEAEGGHDGLYDPMRSLHRRQRCFDSI